MEKSLAKKLLQIKAIRLNPQTPFQWASGILSPIYCDNRIVLSYPEARNHVKTGLVELSKKYDFDVIAGVATAGIPHGALLADALGKPFIYVRDKKKGHGRQNLIEGYLEPHAKVLMVEDLISTGGSSLKAVEGVRSSGGDVVGVLALFSYGFQLADDAFKKADCPFETLSNYHALLEVAYENGYLKKEEKELLIEWRKDPQAWGKQFSE